MYSAQSRPQIVDLKIKTLIDFSPISKPDKYNFPGVEYKPMRTASLQ